MVEDREDGQNTETLAGSQETTVASLKPVQDARRTWQPQDNRETQSSNNWKRRDKLGKSSHAQESPKHPNYFLAVQITNPQIKGAMKAAQDVIVEKNRLLEKVLVEPTDAHFTLCLLHLPDEESIADACNILQNCKKQIDLLVPDAKIDLTVSGIDHFDKQVVYAKLAADEHEKKLRDIAMLLRDEFKTLEADDPYGYNPHLTLLKLAKIRRWRHKNKIPCIDPTYFESCKNMFFGIQSVRFIQLLAMSRKNRSDYYHCEREIPLGTSQEACPTSSP